MGLASANVQATKAPSLGKPEQHIWYGNSYDIIFQGEGGRKLTLIAAGCQIPIPKQLSKFATCSTDTSNKQRQVRYRYEKEPRCRA